MYDKSTHFLHELLQNADDNAYDCEIPTLNITYRPGELRVDCNETGFSEANVKAICSIGASTKSGLNRSGGYIGEKGIGFKSVFKVADVVWISSGQFSFKFDRGQHLGVIAPVWEKFPRPTIPGFTSFFLKLTGGHHEDELVQDIQNLDPTLLIFLRRIREINLSVKKKNGKVWASRLSRLDQSDSDQLIVSLSRDHFCDKYLITKHIVPHDGHELKRQGCTQSKLLLAFPLSARSKHNGSTENVYAFLPIRDYGFKV